MRTHIALTRKINNKRISIVVPIHSASFLEDTEGNVLLRSGESGSLAIHIEQSIQDVMSLIEGSPPLESIGNI